MDFGEDIGAIADLGDAETNLEQTSHLDGDLMRGNVANFVGENAGEFILVLDGSYELAAAIDAAAGERESVNLAGVVDAKAVLNACGRKRGQQFFADAREFVIGSRRRDLHV